MSDTDSDSDIVKDFLVESYAHQERSGQPLQLSIVCSRNVHQEAISLWNGKTSLGQRPALTRPTFVTPDTFHGRLESEEA
jgi:hypothetical protein